MTEEMKSVIEKLKENNARKGGRSIKNRNYEIHVDGDVGQKFSPQAVMCLEVLFEQDTELISEQDLFNVFGSEGVLEKFEKSKQDPWKIFQYYRKQICDAGFVTIVDNS